MVCHFCDLCDGPALAADKTRVEYVQPLPVVATASFDAPKPRGVRAIANFNYDHRDFGTVVPVDLCLACRAKLVNALAAQLNAELAATPAAAPSA